MNRRVWLWAVTPGLVVVMLLILADYFEFRPLGGSWFSRIVIWLLVGVPFVLSWYWFREGGWADRRDGAPRSTR